MSAERGPRRAGERPAVSVVVPIFQAARYLPEALRSIARQTSTDFELIVVDDGSTDDGAYVARTLAPRARLVVHGTNRGLGAARRTGAKAARGRFVTYLSADDLWDPTFLERALAEAPAA